MRTDVVIFILVLALGAPTAAMAQGCIEAEEELRAEAAILGPMLTAINRLNLEYQMKQMEIEQEYAYFEDSDLEMDAESHQLIQSLETDKDAIKRQYRDLLQKATSSDASVNALVTSYETACVGEANTLSLLNEYGIVPVPAEH